MIGGCAKKPVEQDLTKKQQVKKPIINKVVPASKKPIEVISANKKLKKVIIIDDKQDITKITKAQESEDIDFENEIKSIYFDYNKYDIKDSMQNIAINNYKLIKKSKAKKIQISGNCDEWGSDEYNYALGLKRAKATKDAMVEFGLDKSIFIIISYGESNPVCTSHTKECWSKNRRVDYKKIND